MTKLGMNADAVTSLAHQLDGEAAKLQAILGTIEQLVTRCGSEWRGPDAAQFADWWHSKHKIVLQRAHDSIAGLAQSAKNNVAEQQRVSGTGGAAVVQHSPAPSTPVAAPTPTGPTSGTQHAMQFSDDHPEGVRMGDGECVAVFTEYNENVVGAPFIGVGSENGAKDFYERFDSLPHMSEYYDKIPAGSPPQPGDVVVWGATDRNQYGHIAVVTSASADGFRVVEQNNPRGNAVIHDVRNSYAGVLGYLRPKGYAS